MPIPKPGKSEKEDEFISRCMGNDTMKEEYPDNDQRLAVCYTQWKNKDKQKKEDLMELERRTDTEVRFEKSETGLKGYAAVFNKKSNPIAGMFIEIISPGAFRKTIEKDDIIALFNHNPDYVLGRTSNGTLELKEDDKGLFMDNIAPQTQWARDLMISVERQDIRGMSFGFNVITDHWERKDGVDIRTLEEVKLFDVGPVTFPAYNHTSVKVRSWDMWREQSVEERRKRLDMVAREILLSEKYF